MHGASKTPLFYISFDISINTRAIKNQSGQLTFFIYGPFVKKVSLRFLIARVFTDLTPYIASILNYCK